ncbi:MAG: hypothetical protein RLZZ136_1713 [Pseudomonadota bacterium]
MNDGLPALEANRAARDAALSAVTARFSQLQSGLAAKGIGERLIDHARGKAESAAHEAVEIAEENKSVIAATAAALTLWVLRKPLANQAQKWLPVAWQSLARRWSRPDAKSDGKENEA